MVKVLYHIHIAYSVLPLRMHFKCTSDNAAKQSRTSLEWLFGEAKGEEFDR